MGDIFLIWGPTGTLIPWHSGDTPCGRNAASFGSAEEAQAWIDSRGRFGSEKDLVMMMQEIVPPAPAKSDKI